MGTNAGCGSRTSCPLDGGCSSIFLVFIRRRNPPTGAPTVVLATRWCAERRGGGDDASGQLAAVFRLSGSRNPAAAGRAPPLRFGCRANRPEAARASATAQTPFFTLEFLPGWLWCGTQKTTRTRAPRASGQCCVEGRYPRDQTTLVGRRSGWSARSKAGASGDAATNASTVAISSCCAGSGGYVWLHGLPSHNLHFPLLLDSIVHLLHT